MEPLFGLNKTAYIGNYTIIDNNLTCILIKIWYNNTCL